MMRRAYWLTEPCPGWCVAGHEDKDRYDDRVHRPAPDLAAVTLTTEDPIPRHRGDGGVVVTIPELRVEIEQHYREIHPRVLLIEDNGTGYSLTLSEALELARALEAAVDIAEGHANPGGAVA